MPGNTVFCHATLKSQNGIYCLNFFKNNNLKSESPETLFHIRSNLLCTLSVSSLLCDVFFTAWEHGVLWERHCLSGIATVTKEDGSLRMVNCVESFAGSEHFTSPSLALALVDVCTLLQEKCPYKEFHSSWRHEKPWSKKKKKPFQNFQNYEPRSVLGT